jgi:endonuclease YncB( thermonuclease family)
VRGFHRDRVVGILYVHDQRLSVSADMVRDGWAYFYTKYGELDGGFGLENAARLDGSGLWRWGDEQIRPWDYRRRKG